MPIEEKPRSRWRAFRQIVKVVELRLRFVALMAITGLAFSQWDTIVNRFDKWMRPDIHEHASTGLEYYCPMHPGVVEAEPGKCPLCGMPLARRKRGEIEALPEGVIGRVTLAPDRVAQAGIRTSEVSYEPMSETLSTVGYVAFDERRLATISSKIPGKSRVETLFANVTGMEVKAGSPLAELFSPELSQAIEELRTAARSERESASTGASTRSILGDRKTLVRLSSERLKHWGITQAQIDDILKGGLVASKIPVLAPIGGVLLRKNVVEGQEVPEGFAMFEVADLDRVWILAQLYENQLGLVREGQAVEAAVEAFPGRVFPGKVEFLQPQLDPSTRTVEVRFGLDNPGRLLRPGMFASVTLRTPVAETPAFRTRLVSATHKQEKCPVTSLKLGAMGEPVAVDLDGRKVLTCCALCEPKLRARPASYLARLDPPPRDAVLSVPESSVIDTGPRKLVYIQTSPGIFEGRAVVLGPRIGDRYPVLDGLSPGESVAAQGAFLIDAESRLNPGKEGLTTEKTELTETEKGGTKK